MKILILFGEKFRNVKKNVTIEGAADKIQSRASNQTPAKSHL
jgi:hypothetical protein